MGKYSKPYNISDTCNSSTENLGVNNPNLYEGDMLLTPEQRAAAEAGQDVDQLVSRGSARRGRWRDGVFVYSITNSLSKYFHTSLLDNSHWLDICAEKWY